MRFGSIGTYKLQKKSRKDDFESVLYLLMYLLNDEKLPWDHLLTHLSDDDLFMKYMGLRISEQMMDTTLQNIPAPFKVHLRDCYRLGFTERPNYDALM